MIKKVYSSPAEALRDVVRDDMIVAVGDFDPPKIEQLIKSHFSDMPAKPNGRPRAKYGVPDQDSTLVAIATDKEAEYTTASVYFKMPHRESNTVGGYKLDLIESLFSMMLNDRLDEIRQKPDAPFIGAGGGKSNFLGDRDAFTLTAFVPDGGVLKGLDAVLAEAIRLQKHGFTATELTRAKQNLLRSYERTYAERSATGRYRTTPLRALWQHAPYFHDGSAPTLEAVVDHYDDFFRLNLTEQQKGDLVEFLKSL